MGFLFLIYMARATTVRCVVAPSASLDHQVSPQQLHQYANHAAWLEDNRRNSNGENAADILGKAMTHGVSRVWKGYWQRANAA